MCFSVKKDMNQAEFILQGCPSWRSFMLCLHLSVQSFVAVSNFINRNCNEFLCTRFMIMPTMATSI